MPATEQLYYGFPIAFWTGIGGAVIGFLPPLVAMFLTNRASEKRLKMQLEHEKKIELQKASRDRVEEIYIQSCRVIDCFEKVLGSQSSVIHTRISDYKHFEEKLDTLDRTLDEVLAELKLLGTDKAGLWRIEMIIHIYFPTLRPSFYNMRTQYDLCTNIYYRWRKEWRQDSTMDSAGFRSEFDKAQQNCTNAYDEFLWELLELARDRIGVEIAATDRHSVKPS
jgi:hypothetical protein